MNHCERFKDNILDFIDNELDTIRKKELRHHIEECHDCDCLMRQIRVLRAHLKSLPRVEASKNFNVLLRETIRRERAGKRRYGSTTFFVPSRLIPAAGFAVVLIAVGVWAVNRRAFLLRPSQESMPSIARTAPVFPREDDAAVEYVIDEYPSLSVSRNDAAEDERIADGDSVLLRRRREAIRSRMTTVSF